MSKVHKDDIAAIVAFYAERSGPIWVDKDGFTAKAKAAMDEVRKADDWGLSASAFNLPSLPDGEKTPEALGEAEAKLSLELLKYARYARGGRVNPQSLSRILDQVPPVKDPKAVLNELALADVPDHLSARIASSARAVRAAAGKRCSRRAVRSRRRKRRPSTRRSRSSCPEATS